MSVGPIVSLVCSSLDKETHFREKYSYKWEKGIWNIGMPCSSKAWFMPFYFCKRSILVSFSTNVKKSKEDFSSYKKKKKVMLLLFISFWFMKFPLELSTVREHGKPMLFFSVRKKQIYDLHFQKTVLIWEKSQIL